MADNNQGSSIIVTDRNTKLSVLLLGAVGILMSVAAVAEDRILITSEFPSEDDATVIEQAQGGSAGGNFISGGPTLNEPQTILFGPDGNLYVLDEQDDDSKGGGGTLFYATRAPAAHSSMHLLHPGPTV